MTGWKQEVYRKKPIICPECGIGEVIYCLRPICEVCSMIHYLEFRYIMDWPLDDLDKKRLGLA